MATRKSLYRTAVEAFPSCRSIFNRGWYNKKEKGLIFKNTDHQAFAKFHQFFVFRANTNNFSNRRKWEGILSTSLTIYDASWPGAEIKTTLSRITQRAWTNRSRPCFMKLSRWAFDGILQISVYWLSGSDVIYLTFLYYKVTDNQPLEQILSVVDS